MGSIQDILLRKQREQLMQRKQAAAGSFAGQNSVGQTSPAAKPSVQTSDTGVGGNFASPRPAPQVGAVSANNIGRAGAPGARGATGLGQVRGGGQQMGIDRKGPVISGPGASAKKSAGIFDVIARNSVGGREMRGQFRKMAFQPMPGGQMMDPAMAGGGMPPMDPSMMGGGMPPMDPSMMGGMPPMDPSMMGGGMPPMDPMMAAQPGMEGLMAEGPMPPEALAGMPPAPGAGEAPPGEGSPGQMSLSPEIQDAINTAVQNALQQGGGSGGGSSGGSSGGSKGPNDKVMMMTMMEKMIDAFISQGKVQSDAGAPPGEEAITPPAESGQIT